MQFLKRTIIQRFKLFKNRGICLVKAKECVVPQGCQNVALHMKNRVFDFGFVIRFAHSRGENNYSIVTGHVGIGRIDLRIIIIGLCNTSFQVVWHYYDRYSAKELKGQTVDRKSTRLNSSHVRISYAVFCLKKKNNKTIKPYKRLVYTYSI